MLAAGPSAVGRAALIQRLISEYGERFGCTVSHTSRQPREHEVHGRDYVFTTKAQMASMRESGQFLECAPISQPQPAGKPARTYLYGTSIATVREVAATGKVCVMSVDEQGAAALQANKRIDGCFIYCAPPSLAELEQRVRGRLKEADSTIQKRLHWAEDQVTQVRRRGAGMKESTHLHDQPCETCVMRLTLSSEMRFEGLSIPSAGQARAAV